MFEQRITSRCPSCGSHSLFVGYSGHLTCSVIGCKEPVVDRAVDKLKAEVERLKAEDDVNTSCIVESNTIINKLREALEKANEYLKNGPCIRAIYVIQEALKETQ